MLTVVEHDGASDGRPMNPEQCLRGAAPGWSGRPRRGRLAIQLPDRDRRWARDRRTNTPASKVVGRNDAGNFYPRGGSYPPRRHRSTSPIGCVPQPSGVSRPAAEPRPMKLVSRAGRLRAATVFGVRSGGKSFRRSGWAQLQHPFRTRQVTQLMELPRSASQALAGRPSMTIASVAPDNTVWPPCAKSRTGRPG